jgi:predicted CXXCH cytochrome family protein
LGGTVNLTNRTVAVPVNHFSIFGIAWGNALQGPHGGYIDTTDKCKACHDVHDAQSGYALLVRSNIFNTCQYCHDGTGAENVVYRQIYSPKPPADYGHRMATGVTIIPGGDTTVAPRGSDSGLTCTHCHSPHGNELRMISQPYYCDATQTVSNHLLKNDPGRATGTVSFYGAAWCADCHDRRHSNRTDVNNHPVNLSLSYLSASIARDNTNFRMDPVNPSNARTYPICQHCHEDRRNVETAFTAPVEPPTGTSNPVYNNFPHESETRYLVAETRDDLCLNCHATGSLP